MYHGRMLKDGYSNVCSPHSNICSYAHGVCMLALADGPWRLFRFSRAVRWSCALAV